MNEIGDNSHTTNCQLRGINADNPEAHNSLNTESGIQLAVQWHLYRVSLCDNAQYHYTGKPTGFPIGHNF